MKREMFFFSCLKKGTLPQENTSIRSFPVEKKGYVTDGVEFSVDDAVDKAGYGRFQIRLTLLAGLGWLADAFEIFLLSVIGEFISCDWDLYRWELSLLTSVVFAGMMIGSPALGAIADIYGRKKSLATSVILLFLFGSVSAASPSYVWMVVFRGCMGFSLGGIAQAVTLSSEYCPTYMRGKALFYLCYFWSFGSIGVVCIVWVIMEYTNSWRILLLAAAIPSLLVILSLKWYPESARFYLVSDKHSQACDILHQMAKMNGTELPDGKLVYLRPTGSRGRVQDLLSSKYWRTSLLFWYIWFATAVAYFGIALVSPNLIKNGNLYTAFSLNLTVADNSTDFVPCAKFTHQNYIDMIWTSAAEFPGLFVFTFLIERMSRKRLLSGSCIISSLLVFLLLLNTYKVWLLLFLFGARGILVAIFQLNYVMTSEAYPTTFRAVGMGAGTCFCRLGGLIVPYVAQGLVIENPVLAMSILGVLIFFSGVAASLLPLQTRGAQMIESDKE